jgi:signal transduction histidine kinase
MHPLFAHRWTLLPYVGLWLVAGAGVSLAAGTVFGADTQRAAFLTMPAAAMGAFVCLSSWYVLKAVPPQRAPLMRFIAVLAVSTLLSVALWYGAVALWCLVVDGNSGLLVKDWIAAAPWFAAIAAPLYLFSAVAHSVILSIDTERRAGQRIAEAQLLARDAEMRALRAQLHPHFLFNSLNSVSALTTIDPERARDMCLQLADYLRRTLAAGTKDTLSLADEITLASIYLGIEAVRFGERLKVRTDVDSNAARCAVPALILQPLVENAVVHGIARLIDGGTIGISAQRNADRIRITVTNPFEEGPALSPRSGHGLRIVRERLEAHCGAAASLRTEREKGLFTAELILPCSENNA